MKKNKLGFTLVELLAVIVILAIILAIAVPALMNVIEKSKDEVYHAQRKIIERAAKLYYLSHKEDMIWEDNISYVDLETLKTNNYLSGKIINPLNNEEMPDDAKVLIYIVNNTEKYALQLYDSDTFSWYQKQMIAGAKKTNPTLPTEIGQKTTVDLNALMDQQLVAEFRIPDNLSNRCVGRVEIEKMSSDDYEYTAYVDCLFSASNFTSHYVSFGGKYTDTFTNVIETSDGGYVAVGHSNSEIITKYGTGNNGKNDAIIVKFKSNGEVEWSRNFGGTSNDYFRSIAQTSDGGYVVVGSTYSNDGDVEGLRKGPSDALIVKYSSDGDLLYKRCYGSSGSSGSDWFYKVINVGNGIVMIGNLNFNVKDGDLTGVSGPDIPNAGAVMKFDNDFNIVWRTFFLGDHDNIFFGGNQTSDGGFIVAGTSSSIGYDMTGLGWTGSRSYEGIIVKYNSDGVLQYKNDFNGSKIDYFNDVVEVSGGYIITGYSNSSDQDMSGLSLANNDYNDAITVKYNSTLSSIVWKDSFGGNNDDMFQTIIKSHDNNVIVAGYTKSINLDMNGITIANNEYKDALLVKYDSSNGNIISKNVFGGTNTDVFTSIIKKSGEGYIAVGSSFSGDVQLKNFNKGSSDSILVSYDNNLGLSEDLSEPVVLIDQLKEIVTNYGTSISNNYTQIYTTNNPEVEMGGWCSSYTNYANNINYPYGLCLRPFNEDDLKSLTNAENAARYKVVNAGEREYTVDKIPTDSHNWYRLGWHFSYSAGLVTISNIKLKFSDNNIYTIRNAVNNNYIEPLVVVSSSLGSTMDYFFPNSLNVLDGGSTGEGNYSTLFIFIKAKNLALKSVIFTSSKTVNTGYDGFQIIEYRNFDMSITPTE